MLDQVPAIPNNFKRLMIESPYKKTDSRHMMDETFISLRESEMPDEFQQILE